MRLVIWCNRTITIGFAAIFALVPLLLTPWNYELFEYNKMLAVYALTVVIVGAWITKMIAEGEIRIARTPLDIPILLFLASQLISSLFSLDPHVSWFGYYSRFNGGMLSLISYALLYYAFVSNWTNLSNLTNLTKGALATASVVALYGVAERLGIDKHLWVQDVQNRVFSTLGQPNWLAAYLVALSPIAWAMGMQNVKSKMQNYFWMAISVLFFVVLLFTRSRSGLLGFAVADVIFWIFTFARTLLAKLQGESLKIFAVLHCAFFIVIFFNGTHIDSVDRWVTLSAWKDRILLSKPASDTGNQSVKPDQKPASGTLLEYGGTESGTIRTYVWQAAINAWQSSTKTKLIGTGTETFAFAFFRYKPVEHNLTSEWDFLYNKAHNEYLNYLATTGILGLGSYVFFIGSFVLWFVRRICHSGLDPESSSLSKMGPGIRRDDMTAIALFAGWVSILVTNFFGFSVVITNVFLFLFPAMVFAGGSQKNDVKRSLRTFPAFPVLLASLALLALLAKDWYADTKFAAGYRWSHAAEFAAAYPLLQRAVKLNRGEPFYHDEYAATLAGLALAAFEKQQATAGADLLRESLNESDKALSTSPQNVNFWKTRTKIFYSLSNLDPQWNQAAIEALQKAAELAPTDPKIFYNLAILYGRQGENKKSIEILEKTIGLKPNYRDAYYALWVFYTETKQPEKARETLQTYLTKVDPDDKDFKERLKP